MMTSPEETRLAVPELSSDVEWLNTSKPLSLGEELRGQVVVLCFWTASDVASCELMVELEQLRHRHQDAPLAVIGVHSGKFNAERDADQVVEALGRLGVSFPVMVDSRFEMWRSMGVHSWPTILFIDSMGKLSASLSGLANRLMVNQIIGQLLYEGRIHGHLAWAPLPMRTLPPRDLTRLYFPEGVAADSESGRLVISDTGNNRVIVTDLDGAVQHVIGDGQPGLLDGPFDMARFRCPRGACIQGDTILLADTSNHALRSIDLRHRLVTTLAGNGVRSLDRLGGHIGLTQSLNAPWGVACDGERIFVAMAGGNQVWAYDPASRTAEVWAGTGAQDLVDGPAVHADFAQPSALTIYGRRLYVADSAASAIRSVDLDSGDVRTLVGSGLFEFAHRDGPCGTARFQAAAGLTAWRGRLVVADTLNHCLRVVDRRARAVSTLLAGDGRLNEPRGVAAANSALFIADTNHHRVARFNAGAGTLTTLPIRITRLAAVG